MFERILGVFKLDVNTFEAIEADENATTQAAIIVGLVGLLSGAGSVFAALALRSNALNGFLGSLIWAFAGWGVWSVISYFVGTKFFGGKATIGEMLRVIGFAQAPGLLGIIPCVGGIIGAIWSLITSFIALRQGLDVDDTKAFLTAAVGFAFYIAGMLVVNTLFGFGKAIIGG